jgi:hypothetical protein
MTMNVMETATKAQLAFLRPYRKNPPVIVRNTDTNTAAACAIMARFRMHQWQLGTRRSKIELIGLY